jgi:hypothetical protein
MWARVSYLKGGFFLYNNNMTTVESTAPLPRRTGRFVGLATKEVEDDTLAFNGIFAKRLEETRDGRDMKRIATVRKGKREQKRRRAKMGIGDGSKSSHATPPKPTSLPSLISARSNRAAERQCTVGDIQTVSHKLILHVSQGINGFPSLGGSESDTVHDQRLLQACFSHS